MSVSMVYSNIANIRRDHFLYTKLEWDFGILLKQSLRRGGHSLEASPGEPRWDIFYCG